MEWNLEGAGTIEESRRSGLRRDPRCPLRRNVQGGERLTQEDIAARLKVSRQPVTHALAVLKAQGFLVSNGRRGLTVTSVEPGFFQALYQVRSDHRASRREPRDAEADKAHDCAGARAHQAWGARWCARGDSGALLQADMDFHSFIYELSGNPVIADTMRLHWHHLRRAMGQVLRAGTQMGVWNEHGRILEAMIRGDAEAAAETMRRHCSMPKNACENPTMLWRRNRPKRGLARNEMKRVARWRRAVPLSLGIVRCRRSRHRRSRDNRRFDSATNVALRLQSNGSGRRWPVLARSAITSNRP
ncbi:MAG: GntR family transcriptional regulator [Hyphomicrobium sp.]